MYRQCISLPDSGDLEDIQYTNPPEDHSAESDRHRQRETGVRGSRQRAAVDEV